MWKQKPNLATLNIVLVRKECIVEVYIVVLFTSWARRLDSTAIPIARAGGRRRLRTMAMMMVHMPMMLGR